MKHKRDTFIQRIRDNIHKYGHHVYVVKGGPSPIFAYTIGLSEEHGFELVLAGASCFDNSEDVAQILSRCAAAPNRCKPSKELTVKGVGDFTFGEVESSWSSKLLLGATDYYGAAQIKAVQVIPEGRCRTLDVPDLSLRWSEVRSPWMWLGERWNYSVPDTSVAITNLAALRGDKVTEVVRWEVSEWEMFAGAGPDVQESDIRIIPLATLLGFDASLDYVTRLDVGEGCWRNDEKPEWQVWVNRGG